MGMSILMMAIGRYNQWKEDDHFIEKQAQHGVILLPLNPNYPTEAQIRRLKRELNKLPILQTLKCPCCHQAVTVKFPILPIKTFWRNDQSWVDNYRSHDKIAEYVLISNSQFIEPTVFLNEFRDVARVLNFETFYFLESNQKIKEVNPWQINEHKQKLSHQTFLNLLGVNQDIDFLYHG